MKKVLTLILAALLCIGASAQIAQDAFNKWHQNKYSMFIHFGLYSEYGGVYEGKPVTLVIANKSNLSPVFSATGMETLH